MDNNKTSNNFDIDKYYSNRKKAIILTNLAVIIILTIILFFSLPEGFYQSFLSSLEVLWAIFGIELTVFVFIYAFIRKSINRDHKKISFFNGKVNLKNKYIVNEYKSYFAEINLLNVILWDLVINSLFLIVVTFFSMCNISINIVVKIIILLCVSALIITLLILVVLLLNYREYYYKFEDFIKNKNRDELNELKEYLETLQNEEKKNGKDEDAE